MYRRLLATRRARRALWMDKAIARRFYQRKHYATRIHVVNNTGFA